MIITGSYLILFKKRCFIMNIIRDEQLFKISYKHLSEAMKFRHQTSIF